jgi:hypothetical protein
MRKIESAELKWITYRLLPQRQSHTSVWKRYIYDGLGLFYVAGIV